MTAVTTGDAAGRPYGRTRSQRYPRGLTPPFVLSSIVVGILVGSAVFSAGIAGASPTSCSICTLGTIDAGWGPSQEVYDGTLGEIFALDQGVGGGWGISVINCTTDTRVAVFAMSERPWAFALDTWNGDLYISVWQNDGIYVVNASTGANVTWISPFTQGFLNMPWALSFDPISGLVYAFTSSPGEMFGINGSTNSVTGVLRISGLTGTYDPMAVDLTNGEIYVATPQPDPLEYNLTILNGTWGEVIAQEPQDGTSASLAFDPINSEVYVAAAEENFTTATLYNGFLLAFRAGSSAPIANEPVGEFPLQVAVDTSNSDLFVADYYASNLTVVNGSTNSVVGAVSVGPYPEGVVYDNQNRCVYALAPFTYNTFDGQSAGEGDGYLTVVSPPGADCVAPPSTPYLESQPFLLAVGLGVLAVLIAAAATRSARARSQW